MAKKRTAAPHQNGYAALGAAVAILFLLALTSGMNLLISSLVILAGGKISN
jgi:hypothetical protein